MLDVSKVNPSLREKMITIQFLVNVMTDFRAIILISYKEFSRWVQISLVLNAKRCALKCTTFQNPIRNENAV